MMDQFPSCKRILHHHFYPSSLFKKQMINGTLKGFEILFWLIFIWLKFIWKFFLYQIKISSVHPSSFTISQIPSTDPSTKKNPSISQHAQYIPVPLTTLQLSSLKIRLYKILQRTSRKESLFCKPATVLKRTSRLVLFCEYTYVNIFFHFLRFCFRKDQYLFNSQSSFTS